MKRTPLQRRTPLKRTPILRTKKFTLSRITVDLRHLAERAKAKHERRSKYKRRERFVDFMGWVKTLPCMLSGKWGAIFPIAKMTLCDGVIEADHAGDRWINGANRKAPDSTCIPMCHRHHRDRTDSMSKPSGAFVRHRGPEMRAWCDEAIARVQLRALAMGVDVPDDKGRSDRYKQALSSESVGRAVEIPF